MKKKKKNTNCFVRFIAHARQFIVRISRRHRQRRRHKLRVFGVRSIVRNTCAFVKTRKFFQLARLSIRMPAPRTSMSVCYHCTAMIAHIAHFAHMTRCTVSIAVCA